MKLTRKEVGTNVKRLGNKLLQGGQKVRRRRRVGSQVAGGTNQCVVEHSPLNWAT